MTLDFAVRHRLGDFRLDAAFTAGRGVTALFGRSGAGKSTVVNAVAGLIRPDDGRIEVDGTVLVDTKRGIFVPAHRRRVGYVFQEGRLFPHLTVRGNLRYGHLFAPRGEAGAQFDHVVELLGIAHLLARRPAGLSGGEKQRVAIGRALLARPRILLMDEPLAALDAARKAEILPYIERLRDETRIPIVYVTHAVPEVVRLATTLVVLSDGRVEASGPLPGIMPLVHADAMGGRDEAGAIVEAQVSAFDPVYGLTTLATQAGPLHVPGRIGEPGARVRVHVHARDVMLGLRAPVDLSALNMLDGTIAAITHRDDASADVRLDCHGVALVARLTRRSVETLRLAPGVSVVAIIKSIAIDRSSIGTLARIDLG
jgi:molybdate transport system ATP-binding protein